MSFNIKPLLKFLFSFFLLVIHFSCAKDSDLLADLVLADSNQSILVDDIFVISLNSSTVLDVLSNDNISEEDNITITETSEPSNGNVVINEDNTITYTPDPNVVEEVMETPNTEVVDTFTYTTEVENPDESVSTETGDVTVTVTQNTARDISGINVSEYGAVGDGITDDTKAIQEAFDSGKDIEFDGAKTYKVSGTMNIDASGDQTIIGNNATLIAGSPMGYFFFVDKASGVTYIFDLNIDGDMKGRSGISTRSSFSYDNVNITDLYSNVGIAIAFYNSMRDTTNWTIAKMSNCSSIYVRSQSDGVIGGTDGVARCLQAEAIVNTGVGFLVEDCTFIRALGDDGDPIYYRVQGFDNTNTNVSLTLNRCVVGYGTRRVMKISGSNFYAFNSEFTGIETSDPDFQYAEVTGGYIAFQGITQGFNDYILTKNAVFDNCVFNGSSYDKRIIQTKNYTNISITNSQWNNGTEFRMWRGGGGVCIKDNTMSASSRIYDVNDTPPFKWNGPVIISGNTGARNLDQYNDASPPEIGAFICPQ